MKKKIKIALLACSFMSVAACESTAQYVGDSALTLGVKERLAANNNTHASQIHVDTKDGVVTLSGVVHSEKERIAANELAKKTKGVRRVDNALKLQPEVKH